MLGKTRPKARWRVSTVRQLRIMYIMFNYKCAPCTSLISGTGLWGLFLSKLFFRVTGPIIVAPAFFLDSVT